MDYEQGKQGLHMNSKVATTHLSIIGLVVTDRLRADIGQMFTNLWVSQRFHVSKSPGENVVVAIGTVKPQLSQR